MTTSFAQLVDAQIAKILPEIIELRHRVHRTPEIALHEQGTGQAVRAMLRRTSLRIHPPMLGTDVIAELPGPSPRTIGFRADMDAIPVEEKTGLPYASAIPGMMHACGHDGHTAILVGTALVLDALRTHLPVSVRFLFQPGEEVACAGKTFVERGACRGCDAVYALHGWPGLPLGCISTRPGPLFAAGAQFRIEIAGVGSHGAMPERGNNPIPVAASVVDALHAMHQQLKTTGDAVLSVCALQAGQSANVIPDSARILGTTRYLDADAGQAILQQIEQCARDTAERAGMGVTVEFERAYDLPVQNSRAGYLHTREVAERYLPGCWREADRPTMAMEDFAFYLPGREGAMFWLGTGEDAPSLHSPLYDFPDAALANGIRAFSLLALTFADRFGAM